MGRRRSGKKEDSFTLSQFLPAVACLTGRVGCNLRQALDRKFLGPAVVIVPLLEAILLSYHRALSTAPSKAEGDLIYLWHSFSVRPALLLCDTAMQTTYDSG